MGLDVVIQKFGLYGPPRSYQYVNHLIFGRNTGDIPTSVITLQSIIGLLKTAIFL